MGLHLAFSAIEGYGNVRPSDILKAAALSRWVAFYFVGIDHWHSEYNVYRSTSVASSIVSKAGYPEHHVL